jgi:hypothetical protein
MKFDKEVIRVVSGLVGYPASLWVAEETLRKSQDFNKEQQLQFTILLCNAVIASGKPSNFFEDLKMELNDEIK